jgi:hypothetical protein
MRPEPPRHPAELSDEALLQQCVMRRVRRSGPGGQHRNKVETGIELVHSPTGLTAEASERRSQAQNRAMAIRRMRVTLAIEVRGSIETNTAASPLWRSRCRGGHLRVNPDHADFPPLLAEALDVVAAEVWNMQSAAARLGCSTSQLTRFVALEHRALAKVNAERAKSGLRPLQ